MPAVDYVVKGLGADRPHNHVHVVSHFDLISNLACASVLCVCAYVTIADGQWWCMQVCLSHARAANTPRVCRWRHTPFSQACSRVPGVEQRVGWWPHNDVLYGYQRRYPFKPLLHPRQPLRHLGLVECRASSHSFCVHPFVFGLTTVLCSLPDRECGRLPQFPGRQRSERTRALSRR